MTLQDDLEEAPARSRAAVGQEGPQAKRPARQAAGQHEQTTDKPDAESTLTLKHLLKSFRYGILHKSLRNIYLL